MFAYKTKISFYDCDPAGILFYGRIYMLCHSAYESLVESFNLKEDYWNNGKYIVPIIRSEAAYYKPLKYGEEVTIELTVTQLRESSFELSYISKNSAGEKCHVVRTVHVFVDAQTWKKTAMSSEIKEGFSKHLVKS